MGRCLTCRPPRAETCADQFFCFLLAVKVQYNTCRLFPTLGRSGSQSLPCRSLRSRGNRLVQFLRRVWQLQYTSASQRGCMATASSAVQIIAEWWWPHRPSGPSTFNPGEGRHAGREDGQDAIYSSLHLDDVVRFQTCRSLTWSLCRDAAPGFVPSNCRLWQYSSRHRTKLDKQITIAHAVLAHSSGVRYYTSRLKFPDVLQVMPLSRRRCVELCPFLCKTLHYGATGPDSGCADLVR